MKPYNGFKVGDIVRAIGTHLDYGITTASKKYVGQVVELRSNKGMFGNRDICVKGISIAEEEENWDALFSVHSKDFVLATPEDSDEAFLVGLYIDSEKKEE